MACTVTQDHGSGLLLRTTSRSVVLLQLRSIMMSTIHVNTGDPVVNQVCWSLRGMPNQLHSSPIGPGRAGHAPQRRAVSPLESWSHLSPWTWESWLCPLSEEGVPSCPDWPTQLLPRYTPRPLSCHSPASMTWWRPWRDWSCSAITIWSPWLRATAGNSERGFGEESAFWYTRSFEPN